MFDDSLLESRPTPPSGGKRLSLPLAIGLHALLIGAFVGASAWFTGETPEPVIAVFPASPSAPPPPVGGGDVVRVSSGSRPQPARAPAQPVVSIDGPATGAPEDAAQSQSGPIESGPEGPTGAPNGTGPPGVDPERGDSQDPIRTAGGEVVAPALRQRVEPDYPEAARRARLEGTVILEAIITASGAVQEIRVLRSLHPLLDEAAERAVRQWRYRPATLHGRSVSVYLTVTVDFHLRG